MLRLLAAFLLGLVILGLGNAAGLTAWVRDRKPTVVADFLLPFAEAWQGEVERLGGGAYLAWLRSCRVSLLDS